MNNKRDIIIIILSHGNLAQEFYNTAQMITGKIENVYYYNFLSNMSYEDLEKYLKKFINKSSKKDYLIFTDLFGGSCYNSCSSLLGKKNVRIFCGVNLGLLLEAILLRNSCDLDQLANTLKERKNNTLVYINEQIKE